MTKINIFISYSHENQEWLEERDPREGGPPSLLSFWKRAFRGQDIEFWFDRHEETGIAGSDRWRELISIQIDRADIAILLITQDFVISPFIREEELPRIMERANRKELELLPILVEPARWKELDLHGMFQMVPGKSTPLSEYFEESKNDFQKARLEILDGLERAVKTVRARKEKPVEATPNDVVMQNPPSTDPILSAGVGVREDRRSRIDRTHSSRRRTFGIAIGLAFAFSLITFFLFVRQTKSPTTDSGQGQGTKPSNGLSTSSTKNTTSSQKEADDERPQTNYTAKQAFSKLNLYLKANRLPPVRKIWFASAERGSIYEMKIKSGQIYSFQAGAWVFAIEDSAGRRHLAHMTCWGDTYLEEIDLTKVLAHYVGTVDPGQLVLDDIDALRTIINAGGMGQREEYHCTLFTLNVAGKGIRPVWGGTAFVLPQADYAIAVDAETGDLYLRTKDREATPLEGKRPNGPEWDGGFSERQARASGLIQPFFWPRAYKSAEGWIVYNRQYLLSSLRKELSKNVRESDSWLTTGAIRAALGNWDEAIYDFSHLIAEGAPKPEWQMYRGLCLLAIRDLEGASKDFVALQDEDEKKNMLKYIKIMRGEEDNSIRSFWHAIELPEGQIPLEFQIGPHPLKSLIHGQIEPSSSSP